MISYVKTIEGKEEIKAYTAYDVPYPVLNFKQLQRNHKIVKYATDFACLDTETSHYDNSGDNEHIQYDVYQGIVKAFKLAVKGQVIKLSEADHKRYGLDDYSIKDLNRELSIIGLKVSRRNGSKIDTIWSELVTASGYELDPEIVNEADMFEALRNYAYKYYIKLEKKPTEICEAWIYQWAVKLKNVYVYGRTPSELIDFLTNTAEHYKLTDKKKIIIFIHNMSYDIQYLKGYLKKYDPKMEVLATDTHALIQCNIIGFKVLCSYRMTNMSLAALSKAYSSTYIKAVGEIDYNIVRFQDTPLTASDWFYMFSDVASQYDGITGYMHSMGYNYAFECPITSTGFVRTSCRKASHTDKEWRAEFTGSALNLEDYLLANQCFMGGVCIQSFKYSGVTIRSDNLKHKDFTSSYPARQILDYMPAGPAMKYGNVTSQGELDMLLSKYCCLFYLTLFDVHIKPGITAPYIPSSKCLTLIDPLKVNGKVVYAQCLTIAVCEIDFSIIKKQYTVSDFSISDLTIFERGKIPDWLKDEIFLYFENKCTKKNEDPAEYMRSKALLNSIYGMTATAIIRPEYKLNADLMIEEKKLSDDERQKALDKYYRSYNSFMPYQYSIYTTAHARKALFDMIECVGYDNFIYCDTDSVFYIETPENAEKMQKYELYCKNRAIKAGAYVGNKYLGMPTDEPDLRAFRGLHSKCYAMEEINDNGEYELKVTIAGIPKRSIKWIDGQPVEKTNAEELGSIDNLNDGFIFSHCGGTRAIYIERENDIINIEGHSLELGSGVIIDTIEKEISDTMWTVCDGRLQKLLYLDM